MEAVYRNYLFTHLDLKLTMKVSIRREYAAQELEPDQLNPNPFKQFEAWFQEAIDAKIIEPNAFSLATVSETGQPNVRTLLLKYFDEKGFVFFSNFQSAKANEIATNPRVAILFPWLSLERQVIIQGNASKISTAESLRYFASRPRGSQLGAWVSQQSQVISSRSLLDMKYQELKTKFARGKIPLPDFWGGYRVEAH